MSDQMDDIDAEIPDGASRSEELSILKDRARVMGITFSPNIGVDALRKKINDKLTGADAEEAEEVSAPKTRLQIEQETRQTQRREMMKLVRCRIVNQNPHKRDLPGEIVTVANKFVGTVRKFIPFGEASENGYHIPQIIYDDLKDRKYQHVMSRTVNGRIEVKTRQVPEYALTVLPPLTEEELAKLAAAQNAASRALGEE